MTVYFEPKDRYNIWNYAPLLLAQAGAKVLGDELSAIRERARHAKEIKAAEALGQDPNMAALLMTKDAKDEWALMHNPNFLRSSKDQQDRVLNALYGDKFLQPMTPAQATQPANNITNASVPTETATQPGFMSRKFMEDETNAEPFVANIASAAAPTAVPVTQPSVRSNGGVIGDAIAPTSIVGQGVAPGSDRLGRAILYGTRAKINPENITAATNVLAPKLDTKTVDTNDMAKVLQFNPYLSGATEVGSYVKGISAKDKMADDTERYVADQQAKTQLAVSQNNLKGHLASAAASRWGTQKQLEAMELNNKKLVFEGLKTNVNNAVNLVKEKQKALNNLIAGGAGEEEIAKSGLQNELDEAKNELKNARDMYSIGLYCNQGDYGSALNILVKLDPDVNSYVLNARKNNLPAGQIIQALKESGKLM